MTRRGWHSCQPVDLHRLARAWFVDDRRIELQKLAAELGISRATAYRWAGSAEQLVGTVLASLIDETFSRFAERTKSQGGERVLEVIERGMRTAFAFQPLRQFLKKNPQLGLKLVASQHGPVQARTINNLAALIQEEIDKGAMTLPVDAPTMAYALTRIIESFLYADLITGQPADPESAVAILRLLLRPTPTIDEKEHA